MAVTLVGTVGAGHNENSATGTSIAATRSSIVPGNTVVVCVAVEDAATITNVSDGTTIITTPDVTFDWTAGTERLAIYSFPAHAGGTKTFTATFSVTQLFRAIIILELTPSIFEGLASASGSSAAPATGNVSPTPSVDGCYIVGFCFGNTVLTSAGGFADYFNEPTINTSDTEGLAQTTAAAIGASWTMTSGPWGAVAASYKPTGGPTAAISGTITSSTLEADIVAGGKTIIITLTGDTWILP